jgi:pimeloyl-ACP methyl ester carboxylesterase
MAATSGSNGDKSHNQPFSFSELLAATGEGQAKPNQPVKVMATDGVELAVTIYKASSTHPTEKAPVSLLFYHGGGAHSGAGYQRLARNISEQFGITVYLPDLRGHGASGGPRGDAPSKEQVWKDIDTALEFVVAEQGSPRIFLGGHSSGGGLVVNYASCSESPPPTTIEGYVLVAPELGYKSGTARPGRTEFAKVNIAAFVANGMFGVMGHSKAVKLEYPPEILEADEGMVGFNTVNMSNAITPESPRKQVKAMGEASETKPQGTPIGLWVGAEDELFVAETVIGFVPEKDCNARVAVPGKNHLGILVDVHAAVGQWIIDF